MRRSGSSKPRVRVVWDEQNLDYLEANKTPKQKITEPKTPYHAPEAEDGLLSPSPDDGSTPMADAVHAEAIRHALSEVAAASNDEAGCSRPLRGGWTSSEDEADYMDQDLEDEILGHSDYIEDGFESNGRRRSFEERRRAHYDEYRKAKTLLNGQEISDEDESQIDQDQQHVDLSVAGMNRPNPDQETKLSKTLNGIDLEEAEM